MFKICHVSDTHLGYSSSRSTVRMKDFCDAWMDACAKIAAEAPDLVIHSGDVFHQTKPPYYAIRAFIDGMKLLGDVPKLIITGNHETARLRAAVSVFEILDSVLENTVIVRGFEEQSLVYFKGEEQVNVWAVPWGRLMEPQSMEYIVPIPGGRNILVSHGDVPTVAFTNTEPGKGCVPASVLNKEWDYVAMGHIHRAYYPWKNTVYAGSTERCGWSDFEDEPGFFIVEFREGESAIKTHVPIVHRPFLDLGFIDGENLLGSDILAEIQLMLTPATTGALVRVDVENVSRSALHEVKLGVRKIRGPIDINLRGEAFSPAHPKWEIGSKGNMSVIEMFKEFVESRANTPEFNAKFLARGLELMEDTAGGIDEDESN